MLGVAQPMRHPGRRRSPPRLRHRVAGRPEPDAPGLAAPNPAEEELGDVGGQHVPPVAIGDVDRNHGGSAPAKRLGERGAPGEDLDEDAALPGGSTAERFATQLAKSVLTC